MKDYRGNDTIRRDTKLECERNMRKERDSYLFRARKLDMEIPPDSLESGNVNELLVVVTVDESDDHLHQNFKIVVPRGLSDTPWGFTAQTYKSLSLAMLPTFTPNSNPNQPCFYLSSPICLPCLFLS